MGHTYAWRHVHLLFLFLRGPLADVHVVHCITSLTFLVRPYLTPKPKLQLLQTLSICFLRFRFLLSTYHQPIYTTSPTPLLYGVCLLTRGTLSQSGDFCPLCSMLYSRFLEQSLTQNRDIRIGSVNSLVMHLSLLSQSSCSTFYLLKKFKPKIRSSMLEIH